MPQGATFTTSVPTQAAWRASVPSMAATVVMMAGEVRDDMTPVYADAPVDKNLKLELNIPPNKNKELTDTFKYQAKIDKRFNAVERAIQSENRQPSFP